MSETNTVLKMKTDKNKLNASIVKKEVITENLIKLFVKPDFELKTFIPGQYLAVGLPASYPRKEGSLPEHKEYKSEAIIKRSYSIGSSPKEEFLEFYLAIVNDGALSSRICLLNEGDKLWMAPKIVGKFTLEGVAEDKDLILISTGTGLAPYISMIRTKSIIDNFNITLIHGVRYEQDLAYDQELKELEKLNPNFKYHSVVSRPKESYQGNKGYIQDLFKNNLINYNKEKDNIFICGNPAMIQEMETKLVSEGFIVHSKRTPGNLHLEKYW